jgi:ATP:corrinoid adenosyltransferase
LDAHLSAKGDASASTGERRVRRSRGRGESTAALRGGGMTTLACGDGGERVSMRYCWRGGRKMGESAVEAGVRGVGEREGVWGSGEAELGRAGFAELAENGVRGPAR